MALHTLSDSISAGFVAEPRAAEPRSAVRARALQVLQTEIDFIPNPEFECQPDCDASSATAILPPLQPSSNSAPNPRPHVGRLCDAELLTAEQEKALFREMNYLKFRAHQLRSQIVPDSADAKQLDAIENLLSRAQRIRDHILEANLRLVMSIVKKFVTPQQSFDDGLSDGIYTLMQAVEKFDYDRGFRFSTYAYRSIARNAYRSLKSARKEDARLVRDADEWAFEQDPARPASSMHDRVWSRLRERMTALLGQLDRREQLIIRCRYALGAHRKVKSLQAIADRLGVSKERVRQLELRAVAKLREMTAESDLEELFGAALA